MRGPINLSSQPDWMIDPAPYRASIASIANSIVMENGLARRVIQLAPNAATVSLKSLVTGAELVRAVRPEACLELDGVSYDIGGLVGQPVQNYLDPAWLKTMTAVAGSFVFDHAETGPTRERFPWRKRREWMPADLPWPPPGKSVTLHFRATGKVTVQVHYEIYNGLPVISKWLTVSNHGPKPVRLNALTTEILAAVEPESSVSGVEWMHPRPDIHVEADYAMGGDGNPRVANRVVHWEVDPLYATQVNFFHTMPCLLRCRPEVGPDQDIAPGTSFESFRIFELLLDGHDRERASLAQRKMYRAIAPWVTQNPILMHVLSAAPAAVRLAVDQCAAVGFEMVIMTFGSGFDFESRAESYQTQIKELADYARSKGITLGGYSLLASRAAATNADNTQGAPARFDVMPCLGAKWGREYLAHLKDFIATTGLGALEHDGSYPGDKCAATNHPFHRGLDDSQWVMWKAITNLYQWCCANGVFLNVPDWYILNGAPKTFMGYRETNWSLPRAYQEIIERQNIFDGTWFKTPSMGWMFVPLTEYHGGGAAATIEPLREHLPHYEQRLANLFGAGVQACYRGPRLFDTPVTEALVKQWVGFYKKHRAILDGDILHLRRADGRDIDYLLHVNPAGTEKGLLTQVRQSKRCLA